MKSFEVAYFSDAVVRKIQSDKLCQALQVLHSFNNIVVEKERVYFTKRSQIINISKAIVLQMQ